MHTRFLSVLAASGALLIGACSSDGGTQTPGGFDKGVPEVSGSGGGASQAPTFEAVDYPAAPYGTKINSTIANIDFLGWANPTEANFDINAFEKVSFADYYNPDGSGEVKLIMLNSSAVWCTVCRAEYKGGIQGHPSLDTLYQQYRPKGVMFIGTLFEDAANPPRPAKPTDLANWSSQYNVTFPMLLDPGFKLGAFFTADATPMNVVIRTSDMKIVGMVLGGGMDTLLSIIDSELLKMN